ncbi:hypothetical protein [Flavobacterium gelatinilyticum]|uniref:hypothetical protein n=1 Tax=Flavobacterium gelatinilyticum TaxID=3003260 RepID=UPI0024808DED|nr:hypothetical protein [Flavobacterium gelatinilyticum]
MEKDLLKILNDIELRPKMFFADPDYFKLSSYLFGYLTCLDNVYETSINNVFSEWLNNKGQRTSVFWTEYILKMSADNNEELAYELLIKEIKLFLKDPAFSKQILKQ